MIDVDRNTRHYKEILKSVFLDPAVCICITDWTYRYNAITQTYSRAIYRDTNLHYATFLYRNSSSSQKEGQYVLKRHLQSDSNTILTKQQVPQTLNNYHAIKTSASVDLALDGQYLPLNQHLYSFAIAVGWWPS